MHDHHQEPRAQDEPKGSRQDDERPPGQAEAELPGERMHEAHAPPTSGRPARHAAAHEMHSEADFRRRFWVCLPLAVPVLVYADLIQELLGYTAPVFPGSEYVSAIFASVIYFYGGGIFLVGAWHELTMMRRPGMMTLVALAISVAYFYSLAVQFLLPGETLYWELSTLVVIMLLGHWLEMRAVGGARGALQELARLLPDTAERVVDERVEQVALSELREGDLVLVRPGAKLAADGEVVQGESSVNEAMISGESRPIRKRPGDQVIGGTVNGDGSLRLRVTRTGEQTALAGIMRLVDQAQQSRSRAQALADRAAFVLVLVAIVGGSLTLAAWLLLGSPPNFALERAVTVLVIACPHALGLAIPLVVAISTTLGARNGLLVRDRLALEQARELNTVVFDKTGTLTRGEHGVTDVAEVGGLRLEVGASNPSNLQPQTSNPLALAAAAEGDSEHMIARGIRAEAERRGLSLPPVERFEALPGRGVRAQVEGRRVEVGGPRLLEALELEPPPELRQAAEGWGGEGKSVVYVVVDGQPQAAIALADVIRDESRQAVARLRELGLRVAMLTGDSQDVAAWVARELGIDEYFAEVLPEHKAEKIRELKQRGLRVAMVGDGVNDAPALLTADVGIAIGAGTDVAIESAGIILVRNDPRDAAKIVALSRGSYRKMLQNLAWATGYNVVALPLAAGVLAGQGIVLIPAVGALFMAASTVIVALNAQLLRGLRLG